MPLRASAGLRVPVAAGVESPGHLCVPVAAGAETPAGEVMSGEIDIDRGSLIDGYTKCISLGEMQGNTLCMSTFTEETRSFRKIAKHFLVFLQ